MARFGRAFPLPYLLNLLPTTIIAPVSTTSAGSLSITSSSGFGNTILSTLSINSTPSEPSSTAIYAVTSAATLSLTNASTTQYIVLPIASLSVTVGTIQLGSVASGTLSVSAAATYSIGYLSTYDDYGDTYGDNYGGYLLSAASLTITDAGLPIVPSAVAGSLSLTNASVGLAQIPAISAGTLSLSSAGTDTGILGTAPAVSGATLSVIAGATETQNYPATTAGTLTVTEIVIGGFPLSAASFLTVGSASAAPVYSYACTSSGVLSVTAATSAPKVSETAAGSLSVASAGLFSIAFARTDAGILSVTNVISATSFSLLALTNAALSVTNVGVVYQEANTAASSGLSVGAGAVGVQHLQLYSSAISGFLVGASSLYNVRAITAGQLTLVDQNLAGLIAIPKTVAGLLSVGSVPSYAVPNSDRPSLVLTANSAWTTFKQFVADNSSLAITATSAQPTLTVYSNGLLTITGSLGVYYPIISIASDLRIRMLVTNKKVLEPQ